MHTTNDSNILLGHRNTYCLKNAIQNANKSLYYGNALSTDQEKKQNFDNEMFQQKHTIYKKEF